MDANFIYNTASWKPDVSYSVSGGVGDLQVLQPDSGGVYLVGVVRNDWNLRLNDEVPTNLIVNLGAGEAALRFGGLSLTGLEVKSGAGKLTADFDGIWKNDLNASRESGVGELTIVLPQNTGVMVNVSQGIGTTEVGSGLKDNGGYYVNDAHGKAARP